MRNIDWKSEEGNDKWVATIFNYKRGGFFVEGGSTAGRNNSAWALETDLDWNGIAINPNIDHYNKIVKNQKRKNVENVALWSKDGEIDFLYAPIGVRSKTVKSWNKQFQDLSYASAIDGYEGDYAKEDLRRIATTVKVKTMTLETLLKKYDAPKVIEYVGLDIEGAEYETLSVFPFNEYKILTLSVENSHPYQDFIESKGFVRVQNPFCAKRWEHHYINRDIIDMYRLRFEDDR